MKIIECVQGSEEWFKARAGVPTSSNFNKIVILSGKKSTQREKYLYQLVGERLLGMPEESSFQNLAMLRGKEMEAEARQFYEIISGTEVKEVGLCLSNGYGASPYGLGGDDGLLEIKCPILSTHISYLLNGKMPSEY